MLEYALISATVVMGFAAASALGAGEFWSKNLDDVRDKDYLVLHCDSFTSCVDNVGSINDRINYR